MYFVTALKVENYIYMIEKFSGSLISIHIFSGEIKIEVNLPWRYMETEMNMLSRGSDIFIFSPFMNYFLVYNCLEHQINSVELQEIVADEVGAYYSNILLEQDEFILLPFKEKMIRRYSLNGELKLKDDQWCIWIEREIDSRGDLFENVRMNSACIVGGQLFFSLIYGKQNYLCKYELNNTEHLCNIVYHSGNIAIRGVYVYQDKILFRRIFLNKTELVTIILSTGQQRTIQINYSSTFEEDIYGDVHHLKVSVKCGILQLEDKWNSYRMVYDFRKSDVYISNGIIINTENNEILIVNADNIIVYSIDEVIKEIKQSRFYHEGYKKIFGDRCIKEGKYNLQDFKRYIIEQLFIEQKKMVTLENENTGKFIWKLISS